MSNKQFYRTYLEDYSFPRHASVVKPYYGTEEDLENFINHLASDGWTSKRYKEYIEAAYTYDTDDDPYVTVASIAGQIYPVMTPVREIGRFETTLSSQKWIYTNYHGKVFPCRAASVDVCQVLLQTDHGYERCLKVKLTGFSVCYHTIGWVELTGDTKGFPGVVTYDGNNHTMTLFVSQDIYSFDEMATAASDLVDTNCIDLAAITADILGEG